MNLLQRIRALFTPTPKDPGDYGIGDLMGHPETEDQMPPDDRRPRDTGAPPLPLSEDVRPPTERS